MQYFFVILNFIIGTLSIIYGVNIMSKGLEQAGSKNLRKAIEKCAGTLYKAFLSSMLLTALIQSSTAVTVITVGLVNSGLLSLYSAAGIIYGANLGTTMTAQLMSVDIYKLNYYILVFGLFISLLKKYIPGFKNFGLALIGFGLLLSGLRLLNTSIPLIKNEPLVLYLLQVCGKIPVLGILCGMILTMLVHSSAATVGLTIILFNSGILSFTGAVAITLGDNIGTCITSQLSSIGLNLNAKRTAWIHTLYNIFGVLCVLLFLKPFCHLVIYITNTVGMNESSLIANTHTIFNLASAAIFLPITKPFVRLVQKIIK